MENLQTLFLCKIADVKNKAPWSLQPGGFVVGDWKGLINQVSGYVHVRLQFILQEHKMY